MLLLRRLPPAAQTLMLPPSLTSLLILFPTLPSPSYTPLQLQAHCALVCIHLLSIDSK